MIYASAPMLSAFARRFIVIVNSIIAAIINANFLIIIHIDLEISTRAILGL